ncbi:hypothetical protein O3G_MSEX011884 [Manduca sexta]|uniref:Uncharacterized protein n=1 Tax=Manduca sexta TaxID=7130 RepID=A0A922CUT6_MANSE|nr:hypothetical protein O3G_MSEX011884 [Manduca sexta]
MEQQYNRCDYPACGHIERKKPDLNVDKDILANFLSESDVLPLVESKKYDYIRRRHCSLVTNQFLKCRWLQFKEKAIGRQRAPFLFPSVKDNHFYLYQSRYAPAQSLNELIRHAKGRRARPTLTK